MPVNFVYPDSTKLKAIEQDLMPVLEGQDPVFFNDLFPTDEADTHKLEWEQMDNYFGLQNARGLDGQPTPVQRTASNRFSTEPGVYGEYVTLDEQELTRRGEFARFEGAVRLDDLVMLEQQKLLQRRIDRMRFIGWTLVTTGQFVVPSLNGLYEHRDRYAFQVRTASPGIQTVATSAPLAFLYGLLTASRGTSSQFGPNAKIYINAVTVQRLFANTNANDLGGRFRIGGGNTLNAMNDLNGVLRERGLPQLEMYDQGYLTTTAASSFVPFIPNNVGVMVGQRPGNAPVGYYRLTRNMANNFQPGAYTRVINTTDREIPGKVEIHDGHNGGPVVEYPSAIQIINFDTPGA